jgi:hypothetical protein
MPLFLPYGESHSTTLKPQPWMRATMFRQFWSLTVVTVVCCAANGPECAVRQLHVAVRDTDLRL